jgi:hypothetical protein
MPSYSVRSIPLSAYGKHDMLVVLGGFASGATTQARQNTIDKLVDLHGISKTNTASITYDPTFLEREGRNVKGKIRIGPEAFKKNSSWLANVIFHESIHSDQFVYYDANGFTFKGGKPLPETERILIALDECEGFYWPWRNSKALSLSESQEAELKREVNLWLIEIGHAPTKALAAKGEFDKARAILIGKP